MTVDVSSSMNVRSGAFKRSAGDTPVRRKRIGVSPLGLAMLAPACALLLAFFFAPAVLTTVFSFTNMTSATGISGGAYVLSPNLIRQLSNEGVNEHIVEALGAERIIVDESGLAAARQAGVDPTFVDEIEKELSGKRFESARDFERELKELPNRPRRIRDLKLAAEPFNRSILNARFASRSEASAAITALAPEIGPAVLNRILDRSYTGWVWTTENFTQLASQPETFRVVLNTAFYVGLTLAFNVGAGLFLALAIFYLPQSSGSVFSALWLLPRITPVVIYAIMWRWFTWEGGFLATLAEMVGLPSFNYMKDSVSTAWTIVILVNGFKGASFGMILFAGALRAIPRQQLWASEVDGATRWQQVRYIILPQLRWPILFVTCYQSLSLLSSYEEIWLTTNGGPGNTTMVWALDAFRTALFNYTGNLQYGMGAAMALVLVITGLVVSIILLRLFRFGALVERPKIEF